jgi:hypothetical protein
MTLTSTRPHTSSRTAALRRTVPMRVWEKSRPRDAEALLMTTKVVPREVEQRATPTMKASNGASTVD